MKTVFNGVHVSVCSNEHCLCVKPMKKTQFVMISSMAKSTSNVFMVLFEGVIQSTINSELYYLCSKSVVFTMHSLPYQTMTMLLTMTISLLCSSQASILMTNDIDKICMTAISVVCTNICRYPSLGSITLLPKYWCNFLTHTCLTVEIKFITKLEQ